MSLTRKCEPQLQGLERLVMARKELVGGIAEHGGHIPRPVARLGLLQLHVVHTTPETDPLGGDVGQQARILHVDEEDIGGRSHIPLGLPVDGWLGDARFDVVGATGFR